VKLELKDINTYYEDAHILYDVSMSIGQGEIVCLLGRNGAGKSTTLKSIVGIAPSRSGEIFFKGQNIAHFPCHRRVRLGIGYVPEDRRVFADLTVRENLEVAVLKTDSENPWTVEKIFSHFPMLKEVHANRGGNLSGGQQQLLSIARALMGNPDVLLLDEPTEGLAPIIVAELMSLILKIREEHAVLLAEQNVKFALEVADRGYIIEKGKISFHGSAEELKSNDEVKERYLSV
jgi:branched-chain amino acid transport system ATP-binding protein